MKCHEVVHKDQDKGIGKVLDVTSQMELYIEWADGSRGLYVEDDVVLACRRSSCWRLEEIRECGSQIQR